MLLAVVLAAAVGAPEGAGVRGAVLQLEVRTMGTRDPVPIARVEWADGGFAGEADVEGRLELPVAPGSTSVRVLAAGHLPRSFTESLEAGQRLEVIYRLDPSGTRPFETRVIGSRFRTEVARAALTDSEVHEVAGTQGEPLRVILLLPGVAAVASGLSYPVVRGAQPAATAFYVDDLRVPQLFHALVGPAVIHSALIDRVDFFSGAPPARFGRLMSGAVEAHLRRPRAEGLAAQLSVDLLSASGLLEVGLPTGTSVTLAGRYSYTAVIGTELAKGLIPADPPRTPVANFWDYQARVEQRVGPGRLRLLAIGASDEVGAKSKTPDYPSGLFVSSFHRVDLRWVGPLGKGELELGATAGPERMGVEGDEGGKRAFQFLLSRVVGGGRVRFRRLFGDAWRVEAGLELEWQRNEVELLGRTDEAAIPITDFREPLTTGVLGALWGQAGFHHQGFTANLGLRLELYHLDPSLTVPALAPRLELRRALSERLDARLSGGLVHQPPTILLNLPVTDLAGLRHGLQSGFQAEAGLTLRPAEGFSVDATFFHHTIFRAVEYGLEQLLDVRRSLSDRTAGVPGRSFGGELTVRKEPSGRWFGWLSVTLMRSERLQTIYFFDQAGEVFGPPDQRWVAFAFDQTLILNATALVRLGAGFQLGASAHFRTGRPESGQITSRAMEEGFDPGAREPIWVPVALDRVPRLPPFFRLDARVSKLWRLGAFQLEAYLDVLNLSFSREVLGWQYSRAGDGALRRTALDVPLVLPQLGLKGAY